jgi:hypothetical protein
MDRDYKDELVMLLSKNVAEVTFTKNNGEERVMRCTLRNDLVPEAPRNPDRKPGSKRSSKRIVSESVVPVWDLENNGWRSFRVDSVKQVQTIIW